MNFRTACWIFMAPIFVLSMPRFALAQSSQCGGSQPLSYDFSSHYSAGMTPLQFLAQRTARDCSTPTLIELHRNLTASAASIYEINQLPTISTSTQNATTNQIASIGSTGNNVAFYTAQRIYLRDGMLYNIYPTPIPESAPNSPTSYFDGASYTLLRARIDTSYPASPQVQVQIVELDPKQTLDGVWISSHDYFTNREFYGQNALSSYSNPNSCPTGQANFIGCLTFSQIQQLQMAVWDYKQAPFPSVTPNYPSERGSEYYSTDTSKQYQQEITTYFTNVGLLGGANSSTPSAQLHVRSIDEIVNFTLYIMGQSNYSKSGFFNYAWYSIHITDLCKSINQNSTKYFTSVNEQSDAASIGNNSIDCLAFLKDISKYVTNAIIAGGYAINQVPNIYINVNLFNDTDFVANPDDFGYTASDGTSDNTQPDFVTFNFTYYCIWSGYNCSLNDLPTALQAAEYGITSLNGSISSPTVAAGLNFLGFDDTNWSSNTTFKQNLLTIQNWARSQGFIDIRTDYFPNAYNATLSQPWCWLPWNGLDPTQSSNLRCLSAHDLQRGTTPAYMLGYEGDPTGDDNSSTSVLTRPDVILTDNPVRLTDCIADISLSGCQ